MTPQFWNLLAEKRTERDISEHYTATKLPSLFTEILL